MRRVALITGGTGALGRAVVKRLLDDGYRIHVPWVAEGELAEVESSLGPAFKQVTWHRKSVTSESDVAALFKAIPSNEPVEVLVNLVGGFAYAPIEQTDHATWTRMLELNLTSAFLCTRGAIPLMKQHKWGRIVNVSSAPAINRGAANMSAYAASKAAVLNFSQSLSKELVPWGITVNAIVPSVIDTPANRQAEPKANTATWLRPDEIAGVISFLAGENAGIVTGSAINLSRG